MIRLLLMFFPYTCYDAPGYQGVMSWLFIAWFGSNQMVCLCREIIKWGLIIYLITYSFVWWACPDTLFNFMLKIYENSSNLSVILTIILVYLIFMNSSLIRWYSKKLNQRRLYNSSKVFHRTIIGLAEGFKLVDLNSMMNYLY